MSASQKSEREVASNGAGTVHSIIAFAAIVTFALYPGWLFWDSAKQWEYAQLILRNGPPLRLSDYGITSQWPVFLTLIKVPFLAVTGETGLLIFLQAILSFFTIFLFLKRLNLGLTVTNVTLWIVILSPFVWNYAVFHSSDMPVALLSMLTISILLKPRLDKYDVSILIIVWGAILLTKYNAATSLVFFIGFVVNQQWGRGVWRASIVPIVAVCSIISAVLVYQATAYREDIVIDGMVLRVWEASQRFNDPELEAKIQAMFKGPIKGTFTDECLANGTFCEPFRNLFRFGEVKLAEVQSVYVRTALHHPIAFAAACARFASYQLGISSPLPETEIGKRNSPEPFAKARMEYDDVRERALRLHKASQSFLFSVIGRPYLMMIACLLCALLVLRNRALVLLCAGFFVTYYGPLLVIAPARDFRYAYPLTFICYTVVCASLVALAIKATKGYRLTSVH